MIARQFRALFTALILVIVLRWSTDVVHAEPPWVVNEPGPGVGKRIVLVSGDEEYRSEEALPQLAKILAERHGFTCTVLFAVDPFSGKVDPNFGRNVPGLEALDDADLMIIAARFRALPWEQMEAIDRYLKSGKPVIGMRTATHAFNFGPDSPWAHYGNGYNGPEEAWRGGFGRLVLGEKWISHHGRHKHQSTRGLVVPEAKDHPVLRGIGKGDIWGSTDVYGVRLPLPGDSQPLVLGQVMEREGEFDEDDLDYGMRPDDDTPAAGEINDPMMPIAWVKSYQLPDGKPGQAFTTTMGSSADLMSEGVRRILVNATYWLLGLDEYLPESGADVQLVGSYEPTQYKFHDDDYWSEQDLTVEQLGQ